MSENYQNDSDLQLCTCVECKDSPLGGRMLSTRTMYRHKQAERNAMLFESVTYDANDEPIVTGDFNIQSDDFDYQNDEEDVGDNEEALVYQSEQLFNMGVGEQLLYFIMVFLFFFQIGNLSVSSFERLVTLLNAVLLLTNTNLQLPLKLSTIKNRINARFYYKGVTKYVVCPKCNYLYDYDLVVNGAIKTCSNKVLTANATDNKKCGKNLAVKSNNTNIRPIKRYPYNSIKATLERFFLRPGFEKKIEAWRTRQYIPGMMFDVFDGEYFQNFKKVGEQVPFVDKEGSLLLSLNIDWFQPTTLMNYHVGAIYLAIHNLPRSERFKRDNMILVGLMPGPTEPETDTINYFLRPVVDELLELFEGVVIPTYSTPAGKSIRCALATVCCDIPATKKVCGFTAFNSSVPCHKCAQSYPQRDNQANQRCFGNTDVESWVLRDRDSNCFKW